MTVKTIQTYQTTDGKVFADASDANKHQDALNAIERAMPQIDAYVIAKYEDERTQVRVRGQLSDYVAFLAGGTVDRVVKKVADDSSATTTAQAA